MTTQTPLEMFKRALPWWCKILLKLMLSRVPLSHRFLAQKIGVFRHGAMLDPNYAWAVFALHYERVKPYIPDDFVVCELGPGDSLATALVAPALGARASYLIDVGDFAATDVTAYARLAAHLSDRGCGGFVFRPDLSLDDMLRANNARYVTNGVAGLAGIGGESIDYVYSQATLEHIRLADFPELVRQMHRVLKPGAVASHRIDLKDHLSDGLNNLRFGRALWESEFFSSSGFYTNRLRSGQIKGVFLEAGFELVLEYEECWDNIPLPRRKLDAEFAGLSDRDLRVYGLDILVRKPAARGAA